MMRAGELQQMMLDAPEEKKPHLLLDLHNTTSNIGCCIIVNTLAPGETISLHLAAYVQVK